MASDVRVFVDDTAIIQATNTPGGAIYEWRNDLADEVTRDCTRRSPTNNPLNALHRGGRNGTYRLGWAWTPVGSNQHLVRAYIYNSSDHAYWVEWGRNSSVGKGNYERFSWSKATFYGKKKPGLIVIAKGTKGYKARHVLAKAVNRALVARGLAPAAFEG